MKSTNFMKALDIHTYDENTEVSLYPSFSNWKLNLDSLCENIFGDTTDNLPDMPYRSMYQEKVDENLIIQRLQQIMDSQDYKIIKKL